MKIIKILALCLILFWQVTILSLPVEAQQPGNSFVTIVHPVRGADFWSYDFSPLNTPGNQAKTIDEAGTPATWLLRFDALQDNEIVEFFKKRPSTDELGLFLEVTPSLTTVAGVTYNQSDLWHKARSVFLIGYTVDDRKKLITTAFEKFKETFGFYPKTVGAWWIDSFSLSYMRQEYQILANLNVADQFSTDDYQVWGQYFSTPFYPSKVNALVPAKSVESKIEVATIQWAARDPFSAYGPGVQESTYSVQANDYLLHELDIDYFEKLFDLYTKVAPPNKFGQITVGLENDFDWAVYGDEYARQINLIAKKVNNGQVRPVTVSEFARWYRSSFPTVSPAHLIASQNPLGYGQVVWYFSPFYRVGWFADLAGSAIRDLRTYNDSQPEQCYATACASIDLAQTVSKPLDEATYGDRWVLDEGEIFDFKLARTAEKITVSYKNAAGKLRTLEFLPQDLSIDGEGISIPEAILRIVTQKPDQEKVSISFAEQQNFGIDRLNLVTSAGLFAIFIIFAFFLPGKFLLKILKVKLENGVENLVSLVLGIATFTFLTFILGYLHGRFLVLPILVLANFLYFWFFKPKFAWPKFKLNLEAVFLSLLILAGVAVSSLTVIRSGLPANFGLGFWGPNGHDAIWHLAVISDLVKNFPPQNPVLSGEPLRNYHYFYDLLLAQTNLITKIPISDLFFRFFPILISASLGLAVFFFTKLIFNSKLAAFSAVFLTFFAGSFGWIINLAREAKLGGESMFWSNQAISLHLNPPFAISLVIFLAGFLLFHQYLTNKNSKLSPSTLNLTLLVIAILWGILIEFKVYAGVMVLVSLASVTIWQILARKQFDLLKLTIPTGLISALVFLPNNLGAGSLLVFAPFWFIHTMAEYQDRLFWLRLANARTAYLASGWWFKLAGAEILGLAIFWIGNLGTRILAVGIVFDWIKSKFKISPFELFWFVFVLVATLLPLLFIQKGTPWNTIQFFYYAMFLGNILAAIVFAKLITQWPKFLKLLAILIFVILTIPTTISTAQHYLPARPPARLPFAEFEALKFLSEQSSGAVLTRTYDESLREKYDLPQPLFVYQTSAYVSAYSGQPTYVADEINLKILGADFSDRVIGAKEFFRTRDENFAKDFLGENKISYIYVTKTAPFFPNEQVLEIKKIFENDEAKIYKVL